MKNNWKTTHEQSKSLMKHTFKNGIIVNVFWKEDILNVERNGIILRSFRISLLSLGEYLRMLIEINNE